MADELRPRVPMSGVFGPNGEQVFTPEGTLVGPDSMPAFYRTMQPYPVNLPAAIDGAMMGSGAAAPAGVMSSAARQVAASPLAQYLAKALGLGGAGAMALAPSEAGSGSDATKDPRVLKLQELDREIAGHRSKLEGLAKTNLQSTKAREIASQPILDAINQAGARKAEIEKELDAEASARANSSFDKAHPTLNAAWPAIMVGAPMAVSAMTRGVGNMAERALNKPWRESIKSAEKALANGNDVQLRYQAGKAAEHLKDEPWRITQKVGDFARETAIPTIAGGAAGMEAALFRSQYDRGNAAPGSQERADAEKALSGDEFWNSAMKGLAPGLLGGFTGAHFIPNVGPGYRPAAETRNLSEFLRKADSSPPASPGLPVPSSPASPGLPSPTGGPGLLAAPPPPAAASANPGSLGELLGGPANSNRQHHINFQPRRPDGKLKKGKPEYPEE